MFVSSFFLHHIYGDTHSLARNGKRRYSPMLYEFISILILVVNAKFANPENGFRSASANNPTQKTQHWWSPLFVLHHRQFPMLCKRYVVYFCILFTLNIIMWKTLYMRELRIPLNRLCFFKTTYVEILLKTNSPND